MEDALTVVYSLSAGTLRVATPLILAALAGLYAERSGIVDVGLEGKMLAAAFAAAVTAHLTGFAWLGLLAGMTASLLFALLHAYACISQRGNQVVSGMAINILIAGLAPTLAYAWFRQGGDTPQLSKGARFLPIDLPFADEWVSVPVLGPFYQTVVSGHNMLVYAALFLVPLTSWVLFSTRFGLRLRAVGENPAAVDTAGVHVQRLRYQAMMIAGGLCGLAGTYLSIAQGGAFVKDMTAGKGFLALAALVFGKWLPGSTLAACLLFALADAVQVRMQGVIIPGIGPIPGQFIQMIPYVLTVLLLAGFVGRSTAPQASGIPYTKER